MEIQATAGPSKGFSAPRAFRGVVRSLLCERRAMAARLYFCPKIEVYALNPDRGDIFSMISGITFSMSKFANATLAPLGFSGVDYGILENCRESDGITAVELAATLRADTSVISRRVNVLVEGGYLTRRRASEDRRRVRLSLTDEGRALARRLSDELREREELVLSGVSEDERRAFASAARKIMANMESAAAMG